MKRLIPLLALFISACTTDDAPPMGQTMAFVPIYTTLGVQKDIKVEGPKPTVASGKIYAFGSYLFQVDQRTGIHIIDNSIPAQARKIAFLKVPFCSELAVKQNYLYTNNVDDLVVFDLSTVSAPKLVKRLEKAFPLIDQTHPPETGVYFQCPDPALGVVTGWEQKMINTPSCRR
ncbi:MAG TPA: hypothetical protein VM888_00735 [Chitinophagaceae bacterium]|nr:hypothetical protein [Chitinophagaceae bacterium]